MEDVYVPPPPSVVQDQARINRIVTILQNWSAEYQPSYQELADYLNDKNIVSPRGLPWKAGMLYNGLRYHGITIENTCPRPRARRASYEAPHHVSNGLTSTPTPGLSLSLNERQHSGKLAHDPPHTNEWIAKTIEDFFTAYDADVIAPRPPHSTKQRAFPWQLLTVYVNRHLNIDHPSSQPFTPNSLYNYCEKHHINARALAGKEFQITPQR